MKREILLGAYLIKEADRMIDAQKFWSKVKDTMASRLGESTIDHLVHKTLSAGSTFKNSVKDSIKSQATKRALITGGAGALAGGLGGLALSVNYNSDDPETKEKRIKNIIKGTAFGGATGAGAGYLSRLKAGTKGSDVAKGLMNVLKSYGTK